MPIGSAVLDADLERGLKALEVGIPQADATRLYFSWAETPPNLVGGNKRHGAENADTVTSMIEGGRR